MIGAIFSSSHYWAGNDYTFLLCLVVVLIVVAVIVIARSNSSISSRNIAEISAEIGYDARDLRVAGYSWKEIEGVVNGKYSLAALLERGPAAKRKKRK